MKPKGGFLLASVRKAVLVGRDRGGYDGALQVDLAPGEEKDVAGNDLPVAKGGFFSSVFGGKSKSKGKGKGKAGGGGAGASALPLVGR